MSALKTHMNFEYVSVLVHFLGTESTDFCQSPKGTQATKSIRIMALQVTCKYKGTTLLEDSKDITVACSSR